MYKVIQATFENYHCFVIWGKMTNVGGGGFCDQVGGNNEQVGDGFFILPPR